MVAAMVDAPTQTQDLRRLDDRVAGAGPGRVDPHGARLRHLRPLRDRAAGRRQPLRQRRDRLRGAGQRRGALADRDRVAGSTRQAARAAAGRRAGHRRRRGAGEVRHDGQPDRQAQDPTVTMHTAADPLVLVQNEDVFAGRVHAAKGRTSGRRPALHRCRRRPTPRTPARPTAPATATSPPSSGWASSRCSTAGSAGHVPDRAVRSAAFGNDPAVTQAYQPGPWPASNTAPAE